MKTEYTERDSLISQQDARIKELEGVVALQADALEAVLSARGYTQSYGHLTDCADDCAQAWQDAEELVMNAAVATAETVQAARDKLTVCQCHPASCRDEMLWRKTLSEKTEPLRREVAMMHELLCVMRAWSYTAGDIEDEYRFHTLFPTKYRPVSQKPLWAAIINAINNTKATALAYEREVEARGAVKALEVAKIKFKSVADGYDYKTSYGEGRVDSVNLCCDEVDELIRATSKKG